MVNRWILGAVAALFSASGASATHSAQGGPRCSSRIVSRDPRSHDWSVEFIIN
jgi:hypothetical protein